MSAMWEFDKLDTFFRFHLNWTTDLTFLRLLDKLFHTMAPL